MLIGIQDNHTNLAPQTNRIHRRLVWAMITATIVLLVQVCATVMWS